MRCGVLERAWWRVDSVTNRRNRIERINYGSRCARNYSLVRAIVAVTMFHK